jgi:hypothetical protein
MATPTSTTKGPTVTSEQATRIASRTFAAYLLFWVITDATYLPREILDVVHELQGPGTYGYSALSAFNASHYVRVYILYLAENILRIAIWLMTAGWFYRCGPHIQRFFNDAGTPDTEQPTSDI